MESSSKRQRERRLREKRQEKEHRRRERALRKHDPSGGAAGDAPATALVQPAPVPPGPESSVRASVPAPLTAIPPPARQPSTP
jgi:hypothetical protein